MTRNEAPFCWFVDHEIQTLDVHTITVWTVIYGYDQHFAFMPADDLYAQLFWLGKDYIDYAVDLLVERQLVAVHSSKCPDCYGEVTYYEAIEPTRLLETYE